MKLCLGARRRGKGIEINTKKRWVTEFLLLKKERGPEWRQKGWWRQTLHEFLNFQGGELEQLCQAAENPRVPWATPFVLCLCGKTALWDNDVISAQTLSFLQQIKRGKRRGDRWGEETNVIYSSAADIKGFFKGQWVINFLSPATMICCDILSPHSSEALNINWEVRWVKRL